MTEQPRRTLVGVLASHDDRRPNVSLASIFTHLYDHPARARLDAFHFVITGGTWDRLFYGDEDLQLRPIADDVKAIERLDRIVRLAMRRSESGEVMPSDQ